MTERQWTTVWAPTVSADEFTREVAEDRHLAAEFAQLSLIHDTSSALQVVTDAATAIHRRCLHLPTLPERNRALLLSLQAIRLVAESSGQRGDEVQVAWCTLLRQNLLALVQTSE